MARPIRIMHVVDSLAVGGLQKGLANLIQRLDPLRFEHVVCVMRPTDAANAVSFSGEHVRTCSLSKSESDSKIQVAALARKIRAIQPDVVHSRNSGAAEAVLAGKWVGSCALIHSEHGIDAATNVKEPRRRIYLRRIAYELADRVLSVSYQLRDLHAKSTGFAANRIAVIHNGVDARRFHPDASTRIRVRQEFGLSPDQFCIGCVGNLYPVKDQMTLLKAAAEVAKACRDWRLLLIGEGPERARLEAFASAHSWRQDVTFLGPSNRVPELLNALDVYVLPSVSEGISNSLLEAMSTGVAVIATNTGGNPEVITDGESGWLFPVGDFNKLAEHLLLVKARRDLKIQFEQRAQRRVREEFSIDSMVQKYEELYQDLGAPAPAPLEVAAGA